MLKQISVFVENRKGRLSSVLETLRDGGINIYALHVADTTAYGIIRLIVDQPEKAQTSLVSGGFTVAITNVLAVAMDDEVGALYNIVNTMKEAEVSVEYIYAFASRKGGNPAVVIIKPEDLDGATALMNKEGFKLITIEEI